MRSLKSRPASSVLRRLEQSASPNTRGWTRKTSAFSPLLKRARATALLFGASSRDGSGPNPAPCRIFYAWVRRRNGFPPHPIPSPMAGVFSRKRVSGCMIQAPRNRRETAAQGGRHDNSLPTGGRSGGFRQTPSAFGPQRTSANPRFNFLQMWKPA